MKQFKYEVLITVLQNSTATQEEMLTDVGRVLEQELGYFYEDIKVNQTGFLVNDEDM